jgi:hypothetical protein
MNRIPIHRTAETGDKSPDKYILHIGMQRKGTTSIQETMFLGLSDPRLRYVDMGQGRKNAIRTLRSIQKSKSRWRDTEPDTKL